MRHVAALVLFVVLILQTVMAFGQGITSQSWDTRIDGPNRFVVLKDFSAPIGS